MKFKLKLNEALFEDDDFMMSKNIFDEGDFDKFKVDDIDDDFCELDYELSNSGATASKVDIPSVIPEGPQPGPDSGIADLLISAINDEWEAIRYYNDLVNSLTFESKKNPEYLKMIQVINDINAEENVHVGQLQELLKQVSPNASMIREGEKESQKQFNFVNGKLPVEGVKMVSSDRGLIDTNIDCIDDQCTIADIDDEW